jgi:hypothetical protein
MLLATPALAAVPLFDGIDEAKSIGPNTEVVDLNAYARVLYVAANADARGNGEKAHPFPTLDAAMKSVEQPDDKHRVAILVAAGTHHVTNLQLKPFVDLFGGFDGEWNRDIFASASALDGAQSGPVVLGADNACIDGFIITNGKHTGAGGGIICDHVSPTISNNIIRNNATITPPEFRSDMIHQRGSDGGGVAILAGSKAILRGNLICQNTTGVGNGGGVWICNESSPRLMQNVICDNHTGITGKPGHDGSRSSNGGGVAVSFSCHPEIIANVIALNTVADNSDAGGIYLEYDAHAHIVGNVVAGNYGMDDGGGMYVMKLSQPLVERNVFAGNLNTSGASSQIRLSKEGRMIARNNLFVSTTSAMDVVHSWLILENNTFVCTTGIAMVWENELRHFASPQIARNIFIGQKGPQIFVKPGPIKPIITANIATGGLDGEANIDTAPPFIDDSVNAAITSRAFDDARYLTTLQVAASLSPDQLAGRAINIGKQWSVIQSNDGKQIRVWGNITDPAAECIIPGTYQLPADSPHRDRGAYAK